MNRQRFVSPRAKVISALFLNVRNKVREEVWDMDEATQRVLCQCILEKIGHIDSRLRHRSVRGHLDPSHRGPDVDNHSTMKRLLLRLERQALAAVLADNAHTGAAANAEEETALTEVKDALYTLDDVISPASSI